MATQFDIERWQHAADQAIRDATRCQDPSLRDHWLAIASSYERLIAETSKLLRRSPN